ncbi:MAG: hypothetical protein AABW65_02795 [Nanoarchaeota archaeon]
MSFCRVNCSKGQLKIQEMAFALLAIIIFLVISGLFYFVFKASSLKEDVGEQRENEAREIARRIANTPEFSWSTSECSNCIDLDKLMALKDKESYKGFWNLEHLRIEVIYPVKNGECLKVNYPECSSITLVNKSIAPLSSAFVSLCRQEFKKQGYIKCELGKIYAGGKKVE